MLFVFFSGHFLGTPTYFMCKKTVQNVVAEKCLVCGNGRDDVSGWVESHGSDLNRVHDNAGCYIHADRRKRF